MTLLHYAVVALLSLSSIAHATSSWTFDDATLTVQAKGAGVGSGIKEQLSPTSPRQAAVTLGASDTLKLALTTQEGTKGKPPHQVFLTLIERDRGLQDSYPFSVKNNGKAKVEVTRSDIPLPLLASERALEVRLVIASFGSSDPYNSKVFELSLESDPLAASSKAPAQERYTVKPEIHHIFRPDPKSPPKVLSLIFTLSVLATVPALLGGWIALGGNMGHASKALGASPFAHAMFFGSIVAMEGVFFLYYTSWNLFQTLPVATVVALVAFVSGSRALTEVQDRRLAGER